MLAIALSLGFALALSASTVAGASLIDEALPTVTVQAGPLAVETAPRTTVEVAGVATVQAPSIAPAPVPTSPVTSPTLPTISTPAISPPSTTATSAGSAAGSQGNASAHAAATSAAHPSATGAAASRTAPTGKAAQSSSPARALGRRSSHAATSGRSPARSLTASAAAPAAVAPVTTGRADSAAHSSSGNGSSSNPLESIGRHIPFPVPVPDWSKPIILALLALALWFAVRSRLAVRRARRLQDQQAALVRDLGTMQATLVPVIPSRVGELSVSVAYRPADGPAAGGDFYDVFALGSDKVAIVLGDVAGHGRGALTQAALTRYTLRAYLQAGLQPRAALALAGSVLAEPEPGDMQFATVVVAIHDSASGTLTYASAGHPPPVAIGFDVPEPLSICCSAPICCGLPTGRRQTTISMPADGAVCFFSDGLLEARTADGLLGRERLVELVDELKAPPTAAALLQQVRDEVLQTPDDMVACVISATVGAGVPAAAVEELEVDTETLDGPHVSAFLSACGVRGASVAQTLARVSDVVAASGTALLRIERPLGGEATAAVMPGQSTPASNTAIEQARRSGESALALSAGR